jgi:hypothetical protein
MFSRKAQIIETNMRIVSKHLGYSAEGDEIIYKHMADYSEQLYLLEGENSIYWLQQRWEQQRDIRGFALLTLARLGIPARYVLRVYGIIQKLRG